MWAVMLNIYMYVHILYMYIHVLINFSSEKINVLYTKYIEENKHVVHSQSFSVTQCFTYTAFEHTVVITHQKMYSLSDVCFLQYV